MSGGVLVTGGARRVGAAITRRLVGEGWKVYLHSHASGDEAQALVLELGAGVELVSADLRDEASMARMCDALAAKGDWVGLVNSAASFVRDDISDLAMAPALEQLALNLAAPVYLARRLKAALKAETGFVVNIADQKVLNPNPDYLSYTLSKLGLAGATETLAMALAPGIRVNCVAPGLMLQSEDQSAAQFARVHGNTLLGRGTEVEDVAEAVAFFARARNITGTLLAVDAGQHLVPSARDVMFD